MTTYETLTPLQMLSETYFGETGMARSCRGLKQDFLVMLAQMDCQPMEMAWREGGESLRFLTKSLIGKEWEPTLDHLISEFAQKLNVGVPHWETVATKLATR